MLERLRATLGRPVDPASFVVFRVGFGLIALLAACRFLAKGWVDELLVEPAYHFTWASWVPIPEPAVLYALFVVQAVAGTRIALGRRPRLWLGAWLFSFGWIELLDKALYLNHYVLFSLLGLWLLIGPVHRARMNGGPALPAWSLWLLRAQVASVYLWAGLAKINTDWLLRAEPLTTWLGARADVPVFGPILAMESTALVMSWGGAAYDLAIPLLLLHPRTRSVGVVLVVLFHAAVGFLFPIGVFPVLMVLGASVFLSPSWPRRWLPGREAPIDDAQAAISAPGTTAWVLLVSLIFLFPARFVLYGPDVSWTERGYRFAWRVMLNEKTGLVDFRVVEVDTRRTWRVMPSAELTPLQHEQMRTRPDMIRDYALHLERSHARAGRSVAVYADAWASLNGRPTQRLIDPEVDLTRSLPELERLGWIVPLEPRPWKQPARPAPSITPPLPTGGTEKTGGGGDPETPPHRLDGADGVTPGSERGSDHRVRPGPAVPDDVEGAEAAQ